MNRVFWICLAGAAGTLARYLTGVWAARRFGPDFPYGTLSVNLAGCFLISAVIQIATAQSWSETTRLAVTVGFLGGFTTYSSFNYETLRLAQLGAASAAALNMALTTVGGLAAGLLGAFIGRALST